MVNKYNILVYDSHNLKEGRQQVDDFLFEVIYTFGHTMDSVTYYFENDKVMFMENNSYMLKEGDSVDLGVFYISDRVVIKELIRAAERNVNINIILDPNKDAFGREKGGIPNRQVAHELMAKKNKNIQIRWYATSGEQYHSKFIVFRNDETTTIISGSANFTKRNLAGFNLESNLAVVIPNNHHLNLELSAYFKRIWNNQDGEYTTDYETYEDDTLWKIWLYRFQEWSGLSTF